ncbi:MAG: YggT family protein [Coriobacteriia bacterium]
MAGLAGIIRALANFYGALIIIYVLMSWFPVRGMLYDVYRVIGSIVEPYLRIFRRFVPIMGGLDVSPIIAYLVLQLIVNLLVSALLRV